MSKQATVRASGKTAATEETEKKAETFEDGPEEEVLPEERKVSFRTPGFSRMRLDWRGDDREVIKRAKDAVDGIILEQFKDAYQVMYEVFEVVRTAEVDERTGEVKTDKWGFPVWKRTRSGDYEEDWSRLSRKQREDFLFTITTRLFEWEQRAQDLWGEAMFAKAQWEERHSIKFDEPVSGTIDDRNAKATIGSAEERYFALYLTLASRKAEAIVRTTTLLSQRLKDSLLAG